MIESYVIEILLEALSIIYKYSDNMDFSRATTFVNKYPDLFKEGGFIDTGKINHIEINNNILDVDAATVRLGKILDEIDNYQLSTKGG